MDPKSSDKYLCKKQRGTGDERELRVIWSQAKEDKECRGSLEAGGDKEEFSPIASRESMAPRTPSFQAFGLQKCEKMDFCGIEPASLCCFVMAATGH